MAPEPWDSQMDRKNQNSLQGGNGDKTTPKRNRLLKTQMIH